MPRKLDVTNYTVEGLGPDGAPTMLPYKVKESLVGLMFSKELNLSAMDVLDRDDLARKIRDANGSVVLTDSEYRKLETAIKTVRGFMEHDMGLIRRVLDAEEVPDGG